eukprot:CAMPEP_0119399012 /NCGR_PEP_ID=MMETSP1334-20130426/141142_1 /TAXON_ID=127549 /ORGANISM="Calcidiscus leptoporus, Strain RCC1130" /LENGTH=92 /DNA_ID=CAMNT_0007422895 /DNA_START=840 /DNA_END=1115 /DNA_ORIENTATION=+
MALAQVWDSMVVWQRLQSFHEAPQGSGRAAIAQWSATHSGHREIVSGVLRAASLSRSACSPNCPGPNYDDDEHSDGDSNTAVAAAAAAAAAA